MPQPIRCAGDPGRADGSGDAPAAARRSRSLFSSRRASRGKLPLTGLCCMLGLACWEVVGLAESPDKAFSTLRGRRVRSAAASAPAWMEAEVCRGRRRSVLGSAGLVEHETSLPGARTPARHPRVSAEVRSSSRGAKLSRECLGQGDGPSGFLGEGRNSAPSPSAWGMTWGWSFCGWDSWQNEQSWGWSLPAWPCSALGAAIGFGQGWLCWRSGKTGGKCRV